MHLLNDLIVILLFSYHHELSGKNKNFCDGRNKNLFFNVIKIAQYYKVVNEVIYQHSFQFLNIIFLPLVLKKYNFWPN